MSDQTRGRLRVKMHWVWIDRHRFATLNCSMLDRAALYIHMGLEPALDGTDSCGDIHTHTRRLHKDIYRIHGWCFHYVTLVFRVSQRASALFLAAGP